MKHHVEEAIMHYYPKRALLSPLKDPSVRWSYDPKYQQLKALLEELKEIDPSAKPGTRPSFDISEELVLRKAIHVYLSYLGPFAAINHGLVDDLDEAQQETLRATERALARHKFDVLTESELTELVPWIVQGGAPPATVWDCLFVNETGTPPRGGNSNRRDARAGS